jgi:hypothetical protein
MPRRALVAPVLALACGHDPASGLSTGPGVMSVWTSSSSTADASSTGGAAGSTGDAGSSTGSSGGTSPDIGPPPDFGPVQPEGCKGKIDFLFLIGRNGSMLSEQEQLLASLPGFFETITTSFADFDTHIMVANPDGDWPGWVCETPELCGQTGTCGPNAPDYVCGYETWSTVTECDETLGAGITFNAGGYATNKRCELFGGHRYIVIPGEPDPAVAFDCIAHVGKSGGSPAVGDALLSAVSPALNGPEGCNAGFLRSDALLVVTIISDREDQYSKTKPADWYAAIAAAKGNPASVVMLAIVPRVHDDPPPDCTVATDNEDPILDLISMFTFHADGDTCASTYVPFFKQAAELVGEACDSFIPQ